MRRYHRFCGPNLLPSQERAGGPQEIYDCLCQDTKHVRTQIPIYLLANVSVGSRVNVPGHAPRELVADRRVVQLADGSLEPIGADAPADPSASANASAATPRDAAERPAGEAAPPSNASDARGASANLTAAQPAEHAPSGRPADWRRPDGSPRQRQLQPGGGDDGV